MKRQRILAFMLIALALVSVLAVSCKDEPKVYTKIDLGDGETLEVEVIDGKVTLPEGPEKTGYNFVKWTVDGVDAKAADKVEYREGMVIKPVYEKKKFKVSFTSNVGITTTPESVTVEYGDKVTNPGAVTPTLDNGKEFDYWAAGDRKFDFDKDVITADTVFTAVWKYKTYAVGSEGPAGGIVFYDAGSEKTVTYRDENGQTVTRTWRYLEVAKENAKDGTTTTFEWSEDDGDFGTSDDIGYGCYNTYKIVEQYKRSATEDSKIPAAKAAADYRTDKTDYTDWYLPNDGEVHELGEYLDEKDENFLNFARGQYWTSSESGTNAETLYMTVSGSTSKLSKGYSSADRSSLFPVRAIRQF